MKLLCLGFLNLTFTLILLITTFLNDKNIRTSPKKKSNKMFAVVGNQEGRVTTRKVATRLKSPDVKFLLDVRGVSNHT